MTSIREITQVLALDEGTTIAQAVEAIEALKAERDSARKKRATARRARVWRSSCRGPIATRRWSA